MQSVSQSYDVTGSSGSNDGFVPDNDDQMPEKCGDASTCYRNNGDDIDITLMAALIASLATCLLLGERF